MKKDVIKEMGTRDKINEISQGMYAIPQKMNNFKMREVRKYSKKYLDQTEMEWENFTMNAGMLVCTQ